MKLSGWLCAFALLAAPAVAQPTAQWVGSWGASSSDALPGVTPADPALQ